MSFHVRGPDGPGAYDQTGRTQATPHEPVQGPAFARVYELEEARRRREIDLTPIAGDRIPPEVWDEVDAASRLVASMAARGQAVRFDTDRLTGRVVASLLDEQGVAPLSLSDAVDPASTAQAGTRGDGRPDSA
jgi:hypothetical protein